MDNQLLTSLRELCKQADGVQVVVPSLEKHGRYIVKEPDGTINWEQADNRRGHVVGDLGSIVSMAVRMAGESEHPSCWYSRNGIDLLINDYERIDRVVLPLQLSPQLLALKELEKQRTFDQRSVVYFLRTTFDGCLDAAGDIVMILRNVKIKANLDGSSSVEHGKSSLGKTISSEVTGAKNIPEVVQVDVPIFANGFPSIRESIRLAIDIDEQTVSFKLQTLPNQVELAIQRAERTVGEQLRESIQEVVQHRNATAGEGAEPLRTIHVYFGKP
jgi:hypothetical protein